MSNVNDQTLSDYRLSEMEDNLKAVSGQLTEIGKDVAALRAQSDTAIQLSALLNAQREAKLTDLENRMRAQERRIWMGIGGLGLAMIVLPVFAPALRKAVGLP